MKRPLLFIAIFALFFLTSWLTLAYLTSPTGAKGHINAFNVSLFFLFFFGWTSMLAAFIVAIIKSLRPNRKLPPLLIKDSLNQGGIIGFWLTGLLVLQLLRAGTVINVILWVIILIATEWTLIASQKTKDKNQAEHRA